MLDKIGASQSFSCVRTPQQNGSAERINRTLLDLARTIFIETQLPKRLWAEIIASCAKILNMVTICKETNLSAYETLLNQKPYLARLHPLGSDCFVLSKNPNRRKLDARGTPAKLVGYKNEGRGYKVWFPSTNTIESTKDVVFPKQSAFPENGISEQPDETDEQEKQSEVLPELEQTDDVSDPNAPTNDNKQPTRVLRDRATLRKPDRYEASFSLAGVSSATNIIEPQTYEEAMNSPFRKEWLAAMEAEIDSMHRMKVWDVVDPVPGRRPIGCRWIFKVKTNESGELDKFKARLVVKGYSQREGIDYNEIFCPVVRFDSLRVVLSIAAEEGLELFQLDVVTAFLYADLKETVYMQQPPGFETGDNKVLLLRRALYGLRQSPKMFHEKIKGILLELNLVQCRVDPCIFYSTGTERLIFCVYVDDVLVAGSSKQLIENTFKQIQKKLEITYRPLSYFLGIQIKRTPDGSISMHQEKYALEVIERFGMSDCKSVATPLDNSIYSDESADDSNQEYPYRQLIGALMFLTVCTRFDIAFAVGYLSRYLDKYTRKHWNAALRVLRYLKGTSNYGIKFGGNTVLEFQAFSDSDFAGDPETRRSTSGEIFKRYGGAILWGSSRQPHCVLSSCEAELLAACAACKSALWLKQLLLELNHPVTPVLYVDNQSSIKLLTNGQFHKRTKHIDVKYHFVKEHLEQGDLEVKYIPTDQQEADIFTKPLTKVTFQKLRTLCGLQPCSD